MCTADSIESFKYCSIGCSASRRKYCTGWYDWKFVPENIMILGDSCSTVYCTAKKLLYLLCCTGVKSTVLLTYRRLYRIAIALLYTVHQAIQWSTGWSWYDCTVIDIWLCTGIGLYMNKRRLCTVINVILMPCLLALALAKNFVKYSMVKSSVNTVNYMV
jgi:hypothetical protein